MSDEETKISLQTITVKLKHPVTISPDGNITMTLSDADEIRMEIRRHNCREDVIDYFESEECKYEGVLGHETLIEDIVDTYVDYRERADGDGPEYCMSWKECLESALEDHYDAELELYEKQDD